MARTGTVLFETPCSLRSLPEKRRWADCEDDEELSDASTSVCDGLGSRCSTSEDESSQRSSATPPMRPPGQFGCAAATKASAGQVGCAAATASAFATMPPGTSQRVMLMPVLMNGMQVFMPVVAAPAWTSMPLPSQAASESQRTPARAGPAESPGAQEEEDDRVTLMFRNLPKCYRRTDLLRILDQEGFQGAYCFIYVPTDFQSFSGFGYAFVAFHRHEDAVRARAHFQGYVWGEPAAQSCDIAWSGDVQGREQHVNRYRNSSVMHESVPDEYKPAIFEHGQRMAFPAPTRAIKPPRLREGIAVAALGKGNH